MIRGIGFGLMLLLPAAVSAQQGSIAFTHSVRVEIPEEIRARMEAGGGGRGQLPTERVSEVILFFNGAESLMKPVPRQPPEGGPPRGGPGGRDIPGGRVMAERLARGFQTRDSQETLVEAHTRFADGTVVEGRKLLGRPFIIAGERPTYAWKLTGEQAEFLGYAVQKAIAVHDSTTIEAWFTPDIPVPGGPATFGGLPGMILVVSLDDGATQYTATEVSLSPIAEGVIVPPSEGDEVTQEEYDRLVAEKLEELRSSRRRIRP